MSVPSRVGHSSITNFLKDRVLSTRSTTPVPLEQLDFFSKNFLTNCGKKIEQFIRTVKGQDNF